MNEMRNAIFVLSCFAATVLSGCEKNNWVDIGIGPKDLKEIPYRVVDVVGNNPIPPTHNDLVSLTLGLQSGAMRGTWVYLPVYDCYAPSVRDNIPSVTCKIVGNNGETVHIGGGDNVREILLHLEEDHKRAAVIAKAGWVYGSSPIVWVDDPTAKRK